jgi:multidrug efflux pump subunit AcrA (membrane-fusion protein)
VDMKERKKQRDAELEALAQAKKAEQEEAAAAAAAKQAAEQAAARTAQQDAEQAAARPAQQDDGNATVAAGATAGASDTAEPRAKPGPASGTRRTAPIWSAFSEVGCEKGHACCLLLKPSDAHTLMHEVTVDAVAVQEDAKEQ